jgi:putative spermidine/putrescine transport system ATP-binding protein/spermidine/putrescine transport system ATP-binding protein
MTESDHLKLTPGSVRLDRVVKRYGAGGVLAVDDVSLDIAPGEIVALLGPSGCGKTTTLRTIAGLIEPTSGKVFLSGQDVTHVPVHRRNIGILFQNYALFPHLTVWGNIRFGLATWQRRTPRQRIDALIAEALRLVRLEGFEERYPAQLSGGQQQRVALARSLVIEPAVLLLDEPLGALDKSLREQMQIELRALVRRLGLTTILVTHDQEEAMTIADRIAVMDKGRIVQIGSAADLYERPVDTFVADFVGTTNLLSGTISYDDGRPMFTSAGGLSAALQGEPQVGPATAAIRPERVRLVRNGEEGHPARVENISYRGALTHIMLRTAGNEVLMVALVNIGEAPPQVGAELRAVLDPHAIVVLES